MKLDLRKDAADFLRELKKKAAAYPRGAGKSRNVAPVSALQIGYEFAQGGWILVSFDTRPKHERDGTWTNFENKEVLQRPQWFKVVEALAYFSDDEDEEGKRKPVTLILPDGKERNTARLSEEAYSKILGTMLRDVAIKANKSGLFRALPKMDNAQIDIEEFNGSWAWPAVFGSRSKLL